MRTDRLDERTVASWLLMLNETEKNRADRFVFARNRVDFIAAHALLRAALSQLYGVPPVAWQFVSGLLGKPSVCLGNEPAQISFNLSHTDGMAGLSACLGADWAIGFDLEPASRHIDIAVADQFFSPKEVAWLYSLAELERVEGFVRLWTLKEAFIKATGKGLWANLNAFSFDVLPPRIEFSVGLPEYAAEWWFEQRLLDGGFVAAIGLRCATSRSVQTRWKMVDPTELSPAGLRA